MGTIAARLILALASAASLNLAVRTLDGADRVFPRDAAAPRSVFVVSFSKGASKAASEWTRRLLEAHDASLPIFQVAVIEEVPKPFRSMAISGMAHGVPAALHDRFWVAAAATEDWKSCADAEGTRVPHVFVLDGRDRIVFRSHGEATDDLVHAVLSVPGP